MNDESMKAMDEIMASIRKAVTVGAPDPIVPPPPSWPPLVGSPGAFVQHEPAEDADSDAHYEASAPLESAESDHSAQAEELTLTDADAEDVSGLPEPPSPAPPPRRPAPRGPTLEDFVRAALEPAIKAWLDEHLPEIVEARVQAEIGRLTKA